MSIARTFRLVVATTLTAVPQLGWTVFDPANDDTDIFLANPAITAERPNVLIFVDNTANWSTPFDTEKAALVSVVNSLTDNFNVGTMMFVETGNPNDNVDGAYVRFGIRQMTTTNKSALAGMVNALDKTGDKGNNATMSLAMLEIYRYFAGVASYSGYGKAKRDYAGNTTYNAAAANLPGNPFTSATSATYVSPITNPCQKNVVIVISNGPFGDNSSSLGIAQSDLAGLVGKNPPDTITLSPNGEQGIWADEYAKFFANSDCNPTIDGVQKITTYTLDVLPKASGQGPSHTAMLQSMATNGKGKYFAITDTSTSDQMVNALKAIFQEVQAVNTVFASTTLPVSVNVRGTNLNQVYIGVFRPDSNKSPRWLGNLKLYKLGVDSATQTLFLADAAGRVASNSSTGFISSSSLSYWTSSSSFWGFRAPGYATTDVGKQSDSPDGDLVEKGAAAERLRVLFPASQGTRNVFTCTSSGGGVCANGTTLSASVPSTVFSAGGTGNPPDNTDITAADLGSYLTYPVNSLQSADNGNGTSTVTAILGAVPSPSWSTGSQVVRISGALPNVFNANPDPTISNYVENSPSTGLTTFTYQINTVLPGNIAAVQTAAGSPHQLRTGDFVTVSHAIPAIYNVRTTPIAFLNSHRVTYTVSGNASGPASTLPTIQGIKAAASISGSGTTATISIPAHGYSGVSVTGLSITGSSVAAFNVSNATATVISVDTLQVTTSSTISGSATTAQVTSTAHELQTGDFVTVTGSTNGYNATNAVVTRIDANTFQYAPIGPISVPNVGALSITAKRNINLSATDTPARSLQVGASKGTAIGNTGSFVHNLSTSWKVTITGVTNNTNFNVT